MNPDFPVKVAEPIERPQTCDRPGGYLHPENTNAFFGRCMMDSRIFERRRLLQLFALGLLALPAAALAGCAEGTGSRRPPQFYGGNNGGEKSGGGGGAGAGGGGGAHK